MEIAFKEHICMVCQAPYFVYAAGVACPNCQTSLSYEGEHEHHSIPEIILSLMHRNKRQYGRYRPSFMFIDTPWEKVSHACFYAFDKMEHARPEDPLRFITHVFEHLKWGRKQPFLRFHAREIAREVFFLYQYDRPRHSLVSRVRSLIAR